MAMNTGAGSKLIAPGLRKVMFQAYTERTSEYEEIFNIVKSSRNYEEDLEFVGLGVMAEKGQGSPITYADPSQGGVKRYTHVSFGGGYRVTREMQDDDLYGVAKAKKMARELGKGARVAREIRSANVLNNGFTVADGYPKLGSTETLFNTAHVLVGGGTFSNRATGDLAAATLQAGIISFHKTVDENNVPIVVMPKYLVVAPDQIMLARELLGSEFKPYTTNNEINAIREDGLSLKVNHYVTDGVDNDNWFLLADKGDHDLNFFERTPLEFEYSDDFDTGDMKVKAFQRFSVGYGSWRGTYGGLGS